MQIKMGTKIYGVPFDGGYVRDITHQGGNDGPLVKEPLTGIPVYWVPSNGSFHSFMMHWRRRELNAISKKQ